ncbi:MAG: hypothetical protein K0U23_05980 [Gammaproteobacteria bacterium]|nr:hypothetical protein [Gammaproteobacteria bacterium]
MAERILTGYLLEQYEAVIGVFRQCVLRQLDAGELPPQLCGKMIAEKQFAFSVFSTPRRCVLSYQYQKTSFSPDSWQLVPTCLVPVRNAIGFICNYQTSRAERYFGDGGLYDPTNLVCEQLKAWLQRLGYRDLSDGKKVKDEIYGYIQYIKKLEQNRIFPCSHMGVKHERTMNSTLIAVAECLQKSCDEIDIRMNQRSMRDVVANASNYAVNAVESLIQYLFFILRSNRASVTVNRSELLKGFSNDLIDARETRSFKLLLQLVNSPVIKIVNREAIGPHCGMQEVFTSLDSFHVCSHSKGRAGVKTPQAMHANNLNRAIGGNLIPDRHPVRRWFSRVHSGISGYFQQDQELLRNFLKLHELTEKMALFSLLCSDLKEMIDYFGTRTWAFSGKQILDNFQESYKRLDHELHQCLHHIHTKAAGRYKGLLQSNRHKKNWATNFTAADRVHGSLINALEGISDQINSLSAIVSQSRQSQVDQDARQRLESLVGSLNRFGLCFNVQPIRLPVAELAENRGLQAILG